MMGKSYLILVVLALFLLTACNLPDVSGEAPLPPAQSEDGPENVEDAGMDYCALPEGTRLTWFDLSTFIFIAEHNFQMGFDELDTDQDYEPAHRITLSPFWMHETEVTNRQYARCVAIGVCDPPESFPDMPYWIEQIDRQDDPVVGVSGEQADAYCEWIGARLPTEAEWELAARGPESLAYPWGPDEPLCEFANFEGCQEPEVSQPVMAGLLLEGISPFEMLEMSGNVNEWVSDWYAPDYYISSPAFNPRGPETGEQRVLRGGGYLTPPDQLKSYLRDALEPNQTRPDLGFRCALDCGSSVPPQLCQLPPVVGGNLPVTDSQPAPSPEIEISAYCENQPGGQAAGVVLSSPDGLDLNQYQFSSPNGPITCDQVGEVIVCYGPAIRPDTNVSITVCQECGQGYFFDQTAGMCRPILSTQIGQVVIDPEPEGCAEGYVDTEAFGCIPNALVPVSCPDGYYYSGSCGCLPHGTMCGVVVEPTPVGLVVVEPTPVEVVVVEPTPVELVVIEPTPVTVVVVGGPTPTPTPLFDPYCCGEEDDGPLVFPGSFQIPSLLSKFPLRPGDLAVDPEWVPWPSDPNFCQLIELLGPCPPTTFPLDVDGCRACIPMETNPGCPEGYSFDAAVNCCTPDTPVLTCPPGTTLDTAVGACVPIPSGGGEVCIDLSVYVPACSPLKRPTEVVSCRNPGQYSDQQSCQNAGCRWEMPFTGGPGTCVQP